MLRFVVCGSCGDKCSEVLGLELYLRNTMLLACVIWAVRSRMAVYSAVVDEL